jgi:transposase InsO family protein
MSLAPSSYYQRAKPRSAKAVAEEARLVVRIREICAEFPRYGYRRVTAQLKAEGERVNHKRVSRIMRERDLRGRPERRLPAPPRRRELSSSAYRALLFGAPAAMPAPLAHRSGHGSIHPWQ